MSKPLKWLKLHMVQRPAQYVTQHRAQIAILLAVTLVLCGFTGLKQGYHMDEMLSFQLSNARFNPWIVPTQPQGRLAKLYDEEIKGDTLGDTIGNLTYLVTDVLQNRGNSLIANYKADVYEEPVWITGEQFADYLTVDGDDAFNYLSVYFNVKDDNHPPLHFMMLHTMSSLFQGKAEGFMGCVINIAAVLSCCILMMKLGEMYGRKKAGLLAALLYGLSGGAIASVLLIRMYAVMTFFCVAFFYLNMKKWKNREFSVHNGLLIAVTVLGFWTQYFFLFYCIALAAVMVCLLLKEKNFKALWAYIRSMLIAAVIGVGIFPFAISDVFSSGRGVEALDNLANGLEGYPERIAAFGEILFTRMFGNMWLGLGVVVILVVLVNGIRKQCRCKMPELLLFIVPPVVYFLLAARMSPYLVDRYIMALFPFATGGLAVILSGIASGISGVASGSFGGASGISGGASKLSGNVIAAILTALICTANIICYDGTYLYRGYDDQEQLAQEYSNLPCICIYDGVGYYENLKELVCYEKTLLLKMPELENRVEKASIQELDQVIVLIKQNADKDKALSILEQEYGFTTVKQLLSESVYGDYIVLCEAKH